VRVVLLLFAFACGDAARAPSRPAFATGGERDARTELDDRPGLVLHANVPIAAAECDEPCDRDADGLNDAWEDVALERLRPMRRFDENEPLLDDEAAVIGDVGRVAPSGDRIRIFVMLGYSSDYGRCGLSAHAGDSERVAIDLERIGPRSVRVARAYTAAHEGALTDRGRVFEGAELDELVYDRDPATGEARWVVFASEGKHATYATLDHCESASLIACMDEDCGPGEVDDPADYDRLPPVLNAGEDAHRLADDLAAIGFDGESAWDNREFRGGRESERGASAVREKLLADPF
jgi:hypothetical protein